MLDSKALEAKLQKHPLERIKSINGSNVMALLVRSFDDGFVYSANGKIYLTDLNKRTKEEMDYDEFMMAMSAGV